MASCNGHGGGGGGDVEGGVEGGRCEGGGVGCFGEYILK